MKGPIRDVPALSYFPMLKVQPQSQSTGFGNNHTQFIRCSLLYKPVSHIIIKSGSILHLLSGMRYQYSSTDNSSGSYYRWDSDRPRSTFSRQRDNPTAYRQQRNLFRWLCQRKVWKLLRLGIIPPILFREQIRIFFRVKRYRQKV